MFRLFDIPYVKPPLPPLPTPSTHGGDANNCVSCDAQGFKNREYGKSETLLVEYVENYFQSGVIEPTPRVRQTGLPPIYFQHAGMPTPSASVARMQGIR